PAFTNPPGIHKPTRHSQTQAVFLIRAEGSCLARIVRRHSCCVLWACNGGLVGADRARGRP
ncbi:MAG: hypothetical protein MJE77_39555, partial [Proteobacteria bacterium]|nr:hypothetical protein [Pseudomonadota bacterium]